MAERVGIDRSFLADVERGKRNISILNVELIANPTPRRPEDGSVTQANFEACTERNTAYLCQGW